MLDLRIEIRGHTYTRDRLPDADEAYEAIRQYLLAFGLSVLLSDDFRDHAGFVKRVMGLGAFTGSIADAQITIMRSP